jgi:hypothetical protein
MYEKEEIAQRQRIKRSSQFIRLQSRFWATFLSVQRRGTLSRKEYLQVFVKIFKALHQTNEFSARLANQTVQRDWRKECGLSHTMDESKFRESLFEVVDIWTVSTKVEEYCEFLAKIYRRVTVRVFDRATNSWMPKWADLDDVDSMPAEATGEKRPPSSGSSVGLCAVSEGGAAKRRMDQWRSPAAELSWWQAQLGRAGGSGTSDYSALLTPAYCTAEAIQLSAPDRGRTFVDRGEEGYEEYEEKGCGRCADISVERQKEGEEDCDYEGLYGVQQIQVRVRGQMRGIDGCRENGEGRAQLPGRSGPLPPRRGGAKTKTAAHEVAFAAASGDDGSESGSNDSVDGISVSSSNFEENKRQREEKDIDKRQREEKDIDERDIDIEHGVQQEAKEALPAGSDSSPTEAPLTCNIAPPAPPSPACFESICTKGVEELRRHLLQQQKMSVVLSAVSPPVSAHLPASSLAPPISPSIYPLAPESESVCAENVHELRRHLRQVQQQSSFAAASRPHVVVAQLQLRSLVGDQNNMRAGNEKSEVHRARQRKQPTEFKQQNCEKQLCERRARHEPRRGKPQRTKQQTKHEHLQRRGAGGFNAGDAPEREMRRLVQAEKALLRLQERRHRGGPR